MTEILSGLEAGQQLVTVGQAYLNDGDPVRIVSAPAAEDPSPDENNPTETPDGDADPAPEDEEPSGEA